MNQSASNIKNKNKIRQKSLNVCRTTLLCNKENDIFDRKSLKK